MQTDHVQTRVSQLTPLFTKTDACDCALGRVTWLTLKCSGHIAGRITDALTSDPVENIDVWFEGGIAGNGGHAVTDALGRYAIGPLESDESCSLIISGPGYSYRVLEDGTLPEKGVVQNVGVVRVGSIQGTIRDSNGNPIEGAYLYFSQINEPSWGHDIAITNGSGQFAVCSLDAMSLDEVGGSTYRILVEHHKHSALEKTLFLKSNYKKGDESFLKCEMQSMATVQGFVYSDGLPLPDANIYVRNNLTGLLLNEEQGATTGIDGSFELHVNAPAKYEIVVQGIGTERIITQVDVTPNDVTSINLNLAGPGSISGVVTDSNGQQVAGAIVELLTLSGEGPFLSEVTDSTGRYTMTGVPPFKSWIITAMMPDADFYTGFPYRSDVSVTPNTDILVDLKGDVINPNCKITSPLFDNPVSGNTIIVSDVVDNEGVLFAQLRINAEVIQTIAVSDIDNESIVRQTVVSFAWDTTAYGNGNHRLEITVYDLSGNQFIHSDDVMVYN